MASYDSDLVKAHYRSEAERAGDSPTLTMEDELIREKETQVILDFFAILPPRLKVGQLRVLDLGCGNGHTLSGLSKSYPPYGYWGLDFSDALSLPFDADFFDIVNSQRCLINILDPQLQVQAVRGIHRIMSTAGLYLMIEAFTDGLANLNKARQECDLEEITEAYHNMYLKKESFSRAVESLFCRMDGAQLNSHLGPDLLPSNFLSSHYYVSRVRYPFIAQVNWRRNTEFATFFSFLPPIGEYSPIQGHVLRKVAGI